MTTFTPSAPAALAFLALASACAHDASRVIGPDAPRLAARKAVAAGGNGASAAARHIVSFSRAVPSDFTTQVEALGGTVLWISPRAGLAAVSGLQGSAPTDLAKAKGIQTVDADVFIALDVPPVSETYAVSEMPQSQADPSTAFFYGLQWNMRAVHADAAWAAGFLGSPNVSVFILDTGIDYLHPDLNTLVDLDRSVDLLGSFTVGGRLFTERDTVAKYFPTRQPFTDLFFHGTQVAATVSSRALVAAGVTSRTKLVAVKVCAYINLCPFSSILFGVIYAADHGADVVNLSLGGPFPKTGNGRVVGLINSVFNYARSKGVTIVVAAGNEALDLDHDGNNYQTYCSTPAVVCVAATGPTAQASDFGPWSDVDAPASYTNFGASAINVAAPGGNGGSAVWAACSRTTLFPPLLRCQTGDFVVGSEGTSLAAPHVTGAAALLVSIFGRSSSQIKARLQQSADDLGKPGTDPFYGKGRINVARAVGLP